MTDKAQGSLRILLVEDHVDTAVVMSQVLKLDGHVVETADTMKGALDLASREDFDLMVSDLGLPDGDGLELMRRVREMGRAVKGIALSGYGQAEDIHNSRVAGFVEHLTKPVDVMRLRAVIERVGRGGSGEGGTGNDERRRMNGERGTMNVERDVRDGEAGC
ncbi:MAG: response regulator [Bacillota bacterium]